MTDKDIVKAAECCLKTQTKDDCSKIGCPSYYENGGCHLYDTVDDDYYALFEWFTTELLNIANRQKAEIERLNDLLDDCKADTIQEFIKRFEKKIKDVKFTIGQTWEIQSAIKEVVKEMVGEK